MIPANHHKGYDAFFNWYIHRILKKDFHQIEIHGSWPVGSTSELVIGNHVSWWDGFWVYYLNRRFLNKQLFVMMLEEQLAPRRFLSRIGGFSINPRHRSVVGSLDYAVSKLTSPGNLVVMYPQGQIASNSAGVLPFQKGFNRVVEKAGLKRVLFYVALIDYFSNRKPTLYFYLGHFDREDPNGTETEMAYHTFYSEAVALQAQKRS